VFGNSKKNNSVPSPATPTASGTVIGKATTFEGTIETGGDVFVQGNVRGFIKSGGNVVVNDGSVVDAGIDCCTLVVHGEINGNVLVHQRLDVGATGRIKGDVKAGSARVAEGGLLDGVCSIVPEGECKLPAENAAVKATPSKSKGAVEEKKAS